MELDTSNLSRDPDYLLQLVAHLYEEIQVLRQQNAALQAELRQRRRPPPAQDDRQPMLFEDLLAKSQEQAEKAEENEVGEDPTRCTAAEEGPRRRGKRRPLSPDLPRVDCVHEIDEDDPRRECCGVVMPRIGEVMTEQLEFEPAKYYVIRHRQVKYACKAGECQVLLAPKPGQPIEKGIPGPALLAHVVASKYDQHLPLYRQERILERKDLGVRITRGTLCRWTAQVAELARPIVDYMLQQTRRSRRIHTDDTTFPVLPEGVRQSTLKAKIWCYLGDEEHPHTVFEVTSRRTRDGPLRVLDGYEGYLQADAFSEYDAVYASSQVQEVACWAHTRRKFETALEHDLRAHEVLTYIRDLYEVEGEATRRMLDEAERLALRQAEALPILDRIHEWIDWQLPVVRPKSALGTAITYLRNQWEALKRYASTGFLLPDNNAAERSLKPVAIGRKNWMFCAHMDSAERAAVLMSLVASCRRNGIDCFEYLRDVIVRVTTHPMRRISELTPAGWKTARAAGLLAPI